MARIYSLRKEDEIPECQLLSLFNQAVALIFRPRLGRDPAIVICELVARTIVTSGDNPHIITPKNREHVAQLVETG